MYPAFAETSFSAYLGTAATLIAGDNLENSDTTAGNAIIFGRIQATAQNEEGTVGGLVRIMAGHNLPLDRPLDRALRRAPYAYAWWKPTEQVRLQLGFIDSFSVSDIVNWYYHANDVEDLIAAAAYHYTGFDWNNPFLRSTGFYDGTWWYGASLSINPIKPLFLNFAIPYPLGEENAEKAIDVYRRIHAQIRYTVGDLGRLAFTYKGGEEFFGIMNADNYSNSPESMNDFLIDPYTLSTLYGSFYLFGLLENFEFNIGAGYSLPISNGDVDYYPPVQLGLGIGYEHGNFTLKSRLGVTFAGSLRSEGIRVDDPLRLGFGILPSYDFDAFRGYLNMGFTYIDDSSVFNWHVNPYVAKRIESCMVFLGFNLQHYDGSEKRTVWAISTAITYEF